MTIHTRSPTNMIKQKQFYKENGPNNLIEVMHIKSATVRVLWLLFHNNNNNNVVLTSII